MEIVDVSYAGLIFLALRMYLAQLAAWWARGRHPWWRARGTGKQVIFLTLHLSIYSARLAIDSRIIRSYPLSGGYSSRLRYSYIWD